MGPLLSEHTQVLQILERLQKKKTSPKHLTIRKQTTAKMLIPKADRKKIHEYLFREGVLVYVPSSFSTEAKLQFGLFSVETLSLYHLSSNTDSKQRQKRLQPPPARRD